MKVVVTDQAIQRLEDSLAFYSEELSIPIVNLEKIKISLFKRIKSLEKNPLQGQLEPYLLKLKKGHRRLIEGHFKIIYRVDDQLVYVTDFFDSRKNPSQMKG